ncbi:MAG: hypothetical protein JW760_06680 [Spirochaetales bacterium]|nr:hypothetical protein [Spirochaetales bacterium]
MNYGDNLYIINEIIKLLEHSVKLEADENLNGEILTQQLFFAHSALVALNDESSKINGLSHYEDTLRSIMKSKYRFLAFLHTLEHCPEAIRRRFHVEDEDTRTMKKAQEEDINGIEAYFADKESLLPPEDLVSQEEFRYLFGNEESD